MADQSVIPSAPTPTEDVFGLVYRHNGPLNLDPLGRDAERTRRLVDQVSPWRNRIINGNFVVNQGAYVSGTALAAGAYGHDGWKAGASGCTYTFTQLANSTTITITAGSLIQVIEDKMVEGGAYWATWTGTAQARVGVNSATPAGSYAGRLSRWGNTAGTTMSIEFNAGTLGEVNLQPGRFPVAFTSRPYAQELLLCQRFYRPLGNGLVGGCHSTTQAAFGFQFEPPMRAAPTFTLLSSTPRIFIFGTGGFTAVSGTIGPYNIAPTASGGIQLFGGFTGLTVGANCTMDGDFFCASARL